MLAMHFGWSPGSIPLFPASIAHYSEENISKFSFKNKVKLELRWFPPHSQFLPLASRRIPAEPQDLRGRGEPYQFFGHSNTSHLGPHLAAKNDQLSSVWVVRWNVVPWPRTSSKTSSTYAMTYNHVSIGK